MGRPWLETNGGKAGGDIGMTQGFLQDPVAPPTKKKTNRLFSKRRRKVNFINKYKRIFHFNEMEKKLINKLFIIALLSSKNMNAG